MTESKVVPVVRRVTELEVVSILKRVPIAAA
jgi:hypothetical protein